MKRKKVLSENMSYLKLNQESEQFASEYSQLQEILADRYQQEMTKAIRNIKEEVNNAESPYLGLDLAPIIHDSLTIVDISK